jgi:hypothetical protein
VLNIGVEINPPNEGVNRSVYGQIVRDGTGAFHLAHKGGLGGGRGGTVKTQKFWRLFGSPELELVKWSEDGRQAKMYIIGMIGGPELTSRLCYFIAEAERIKRLAKSGQLS